MKETISINGNEVTIDNQSVMLNFNQVMALKVLNRAYPAVVSNKGIMSAAGIKSLHSLVQTIGQLRKKLSAFGFVEIPNHPKNGYALKINEAENDEPQNGEWWMCETSMNKEIPLYMNKSGDKDFYSSNDLSAMKIEGSVTPLYRMVKG